MHIKRPVMEVGVLTFDDPWEAARCVKSLIALGFSAKIDDEKIGRVLMGVGDKTGEMLSLMATVYGQGVVDGRKESKVG